jgi:hypothetical protein
MSEPFDLSDWWIVATNGIFLVGKRDGSTLKSLHRLEMPMVPEPTPDGRGVRPRIVTAVYPWIVDSLVIPPEAIWIHCEAFTGNKAELTNCIVNSEQLKMVRRADKAGLSIVRGH